MSQGTGMQKIGLVLAGFGIGFIVLGAHLSINGLPAIGNILLIAGLTFVVGIDRTLSFVFQEHMWKGALLFFGGFLIVIFGFPLIGMCVEASGFVILSTCPKPTCLPKRAPSPLKASSLVPILCKEETNRKYSFKTIIFITLTVNPDADEPVSDTEVETWLSEFMISLQRCFNDRTIFWTQKDIVTFFETKGLHHLLACDRRQLENMVSQYFMSQRDSIAGLLRAHGRLEIINAIRKCGFNKSLLIDYANGNVCRNLALDTNSNLSIDALMDCIILTAQRSIMEAEVMAMVELNLPTPAAGKLCVALLRNDSVKEILGTPRLLYDNFIKVVSEARDIKRAECLLLQECPLCLEKCSKESLWSLISCECEMCYVCFIKYFQIVIKNEPPTSWACPICSEPNLNGIFATNDPLLVAQREDKLESHLAKMTLIVNSRFHLLELKDLLNNKLTTWKLSQDEHFLWCAHGCGNGVIYLGRERFSTCPQCKRSTCRDCKKIWEPEHRNKTCEQFEAWKIAQDPHIAKLMQLSGIVCPKCHMRYELVRGGCLHFTCHQCKYEFCGGCNKAIYTKDGCCPDGCVGLGLHAHHPRDCLYFLRDWDVATLEKLLADNNVAVNAPTEGLLKCPVRLSDSLKSMEVECGSKCSKADLCQVHYKEYLVTLINRNKLDPAPLMDVDCLLSCLLREKKPILVKESQESPETFRQRIVRHLKATCPIAVSS